MKIKIILINAVALILSSFSFAIFIVFSILATTVVTAPFLELEVFTKISSTVFGIFFWGIQVLFFVTVAWYLYRKKLYAIALGIPLGFLLLLWLGPIIQRGID